MTLTTYSLHTYSYHDSTGAYLGFRKERGQVEISRARRRKPPKGSRGLGVGKGCPENFGWAKENFGIFFLEMIHFGAFLCAFEQILNL